MIRTATGMLEGHDAGRKAFQPHGAMSGPGLMAKQCATGRHSDVPDAQSGRRMALSQRERERIRCSKASSEVDKTTACLCRIASSTMALPFVDHSFARAQTRAPAIHV